MRRSAACHATNRRDASLAACRTRHAPSARERQPMGSRQAMDRANGLFRSRASSSRTRGETPPRFRLGASASGPIGAARMRIILGQLVQVSTGAARVAGAGFVVCSEENLIVFHTAGSLQILPPAWRTTSPSCPHAKGRNFFQHAGSRGESGRSSRVNLVSLPSVARRLLMASVTVTTASLRVSATRPRCARLSLATLGATQPARAFLLRS